MSFTGPRALIKCKWPEWQRRFWARARQLGLSDDDISKTTDWGRGGDQWDAYLYGDEPEEACDEHYGRE